ncbi:MAG: hypothetical protein KGJ78_07375 [Alphaproteobacteria bacterium]|nr:hypothetical protein [Alphaproteobacteria bacterium]
MENQQSSLRRILLLLTTTVAALGVAVGLPMKRASAQPRDREMAPSPMMHQPPSRLVVIQPRFVNPTAVGLLRIADEALSNEDLAQRIFRQPDAVAAQFHLSNAERLVLRHMTAEQFEVARADASRVVADRLSRAGTMRLPPGATDARLITERMIVGRAILAAAGRSYLEAADAHGCCPWSKAIELGLNSDPAYYNEVFRRPAGGAL